MEQLHYGSNRHAILLIFQAMDVYSEPPHVGRGGWTRYTGSAGWMYRVALERLLGFRGQGANLLLYPGDRVMAMPRPCWFAILSGNDSHHLPSQRDTE
jgi:hypothetical protein